MLGVTLAFWLRLHFSATGMKLMRLSEHLMPRSVAGGEQIVR